MTKFERNGAGGGMMSKKKYELTPEEEAELEREIERKRREAKRAKIQSDRIARRHASIANLISQTYDILFPPEDDPVAPPEERLLEAIFGRENNVPMAEEVAFVDTVTNMAETLVRKYHASTSQQEEK